MQTKGLEIKPKPDPLLNSCAEAGTWTLTVAWRAPEVGGPSIVESARVQIHTKDSDPTIFGS